MTKILHIVPGTDDVANGMAAAARLIAKAQGDAQVVDLRDCSQALGCKDVEEVWVHGLWLPGEWRACWQVLRQGKRLCRMTHGSLSPVYLKRQSPLKKRLASPIERYFLRQADQVVATCEKEQEWILHYERKVRQVEVVDLKRFFALGKGSETFESQVRAGSNLHLLYLGRRHPLKGLEYLEQAVRGMDAVELRIISNAFGDEKEKAWDWCDVLVLPTLSDNFGLVVAEALARGKRVVTTDGAPAWGDNEDYGGRLQYLKGFVAASPANRVALLKAALGKL